MAQKCKFSDLVVIVPGIMGSVLQKDGKNIWDASYPVLGQTLFSKGDSLQSLILKQDDPEAEILEDGITATGVIEDALLVPGLVKVDGYTKTASLFTDNLDITPGNIHTDPDDKPANFYYFPYDWRRDCRVNAKLLKRLVDKRLKRWQEYSGAKDAKLILLAHSMGGLISRYYIEVLEGWRDCKALFTFGTPYRGSVQAVSYLANGYKQMFIDVTEVVRSLTSAYQLLPIYEMLKVGNEYKRIAEVDNLPYIENRRTQEALAFHREIEAAVKKHSNDENYRNLHTTVPIVGIQQPTIQSAIFSDGKITASEDVPAILQNRPDLSDGDGTVPQVSAVPIELSNSFNNCFIAETHASLQKQPQILDDLLCRLKLTQFNLAGVKAPQSAISLSLDDLYTSSEQVKIRARVISTSLGYGKLKAKITSVSQNETTTYFDFERHEQEWVLNFEAPRGAYRIQAYTENSNSQTPNPVNDLFEVA